MNDIAKLVPRAKVRREDTIKILRELLAKAETGEIDTVVVAAGLTNEPAVMFRSSTQDLTLMIGWLERAKARLFATDIDESWGPARDE